jgi:group I intron endonuclease
VGILYKFTFTNGKSYIGVTTQKFKLRIANHKWKSSVNKPSCKVHKAWKKYGEPLIEILAYVENKDLYETEVRAIKILNTYGEHGYNSTAGGEASPMLNPTIAKKVSALASTPERIARNIQIHLGSKRSEESKRKMSEMRKGLNLGVPKSSTHRANIAKALKGKKLALGRKHSDESKIKMSESAILAKPKSNNTSGYKGVSFCKRQNKWRARFHKLGKTYYLGSYDTSIEANEAYLNFTKDFI